MPETDFRTRRAMLAGAGAAAAAVAANAVLAARPALAADASVLLGLPNDAGAAATTLTAAIAAEAALGVRNSDSGLDGSAISGASDTGTGVLGLSSTGTGVVGSASADAGTGVSGEAAETGTGVFGTAGTYPGILDTTYTGVFGWAPYGTDTTFGAGVWGLSDNTGVYGEGGAGVYGYSSDGAGLVGESDTGYGLYVYGKVRFADRQGRATIKRGRSSWSKSISGVTSGNVVIAVLQSSETGVWVRAAVASSGSIKVYLNKALSSSATIGWIVLG
jgi:hypothetical protein